jgi:GNAT superfamily N-acetyltransferase
VTFVINQRKIDEHVYAVEPRARTYPLTCSACGSTEVGKSVSTEAAGGRLFILGESSVGFNPQRWLGFCEDCWPRWLMWRARMGYDLHGSHGPHERCGPGCIAVQGGRANQVAAQMSMAFSRTDGFFLVKSIDGQPYVNGSQLLWSMRTFHFITRMNHRQDYYESLSDAAEVRRRFLYGFQLQQLGVPRAQIDGILIVVEAFESWYTAPGGGIRMPVPGDRSIGMHCVLLTHYSDSGPTIGFVNCWGSAWGDRGHGTISFSYLERYLHEAFVMRRARWGPPLSNFVTLPESPTRQDIRRFITQQSARERVRRRGTRGANWVVEAYMTPSPSTEAMVMCVEVQNGFGLRMGWVFLRQSWQKNGSVVCEIPELFVWPIFQRMGIGRYLEAAAVDYATAWGCTEIQLILNEADSIIGPHRAAARLFGQAMGYEWHWRPDVAPRRVATGVKRVNVAV